MYYIYKISCILKDHPDSYVGVTKDLKKRISGHQSATKTQKRTLYNYIRDVGWENIKFDVIEELKTDDSLIAKQKERFYIDLISPSLNICLPLRTSKEYREDNREELKLKRNCMHLKKRNKRNMKSLEYYYENKNKLLENNRNYKNINKEKLKSNRTNKIFCKCGKELTLGAYKYHIKSKQHSIDLLKNINNVNLKYSHKNIDIRL